MHYFWPHVHAMHIINPHRCHANRALTLKCIVRIWTSSGLSVDCVVPMYTKTPLQKGSVLDALIRIPNHCGVTMLSTRTSSTEKCTVLSYSASEGLQFLPYVETRKTHTRRRPEHAHIKLIRCVLPHPFQIMEDLYCDWEPGSSSLTTPFSLKPLNHILQLRHSRSMWISQSK